MVFLGGIVTWIALYVKDWLGYAAGDTQVIKFMIGPAIGVLWLIHMSAFDAATGQSRIESKIDPLLLKMRDLKDLAGAARSVCWLLKGIGPTEDVTVDFFGHNLTHAKDYIDDIVFAAANAKKLHLRLLMIDPDVDQSFKPQYFFQTAALGKSSLTDIEAKLKQRSHEAKALQADIEVKGYREYPYIGGFRVYIPSRETTYFFVSFVGVRQDTGQHGWYDKYISARVLGKSGQPKRDSCSPINYLAAELYTGLFDYVYNHDSTKVLANLTNYPSNTTFQKLEQT